MDASNLHHILVPIDFSGPSLNAMDTAIAMAKRHGAKLTLLHVVNQGLLSYHPADVIPIVTADPMIEVLRDEATEMLLKITEKVTLEHGLEVNGQTTQGFVSSEICNTAEILGVDIIVLGAHGVSGFREFFMGTNAYAVVKHAICPVLTIPENGKWTSFSTILFPVRDTPDALHKYDFLRKIIHHNSAMLHVIGFPSAQRPSSKNWVGERILQLQSKLRFDEVDCVTQELAPTERVAEVVLQASETVKADLIAITATLDFGIRDFFIGPYTQQIVNHAKVPVLSIRPQQHVDSEPDIAGVMRSEYSPLSPGFGLSLHTSFHLISKRNEEYKFQNIE